MRIEKDAPAFFSIRIPLSGTGCYNAGTRGSTMLPIIIISIISIVVAIGVYQLVIQKYYWGPSGAPRQSRSEKKKRVSK